jgi:uncharacterized protein YgiM (DUF1202 family)
LFCAIIAGVFILHCGTAFAEENVTEPSPFYQTEDGVLSIQAPSPQWRVMSDPNYWFVLSDGGNMIAISHLRNGEELPAPVVAGGDEAAVYQAYVSTNNEVFVIKGTAVKEEDLEVIMKAISTIKVLKYNTKTALSKDTATASGFSIRPINETYYSTSDHLNVRLGCSTNDTKIGHFTNGQPVSVLGAVTKDGKEIGWYQILFNDTTAYVSSEYLTKTKPETSNDEKVAKESEAAASEPFTVYDRNWNPVQIYRVDTFKYKDKYGNDYSQVRGTMYCREDIGVLYSVDPNYWTEEEYEAAAAAEAFTVYAEDGRTAHIYLTGDGMYEDSNGRKYSNTRGDLYYCIDTDVTYSSDPDIWSDGEPTPDDYDDGGYGEDEEDEYMAGDDYDDDYDYDYEEAEDYDIY